MKRKIINGLLGLFTVGVILAVLFAFIMEISTCNTRPLRKIHSSLNIEPSSSCTLENVWDELIYQGVKYPQIVYKQMILETGWLKSYNARVKNNLFGLTFKGKYLIFDDYKDCVSYIKSWQNRHYHGGNYYAFLEDIGYSENPDYCKTLKKIKIRF